MENLANKFKVNKDNYFNENNLINGYSEDLQAIINQKKESK